jgi:hypothetical protein
MPSLRYPVVNGVENAIVELIMRVIALVDAAKRPLEPS